MSDFSINHTETSQLTDQEVETHVSSLDEYRQTLQSVVESKEYNQPEAALNLPDDPEILKQVKAAITSLPTDGLPDVVVVVGMGGSSRGTKAVFELLADQTDTTVRFVDTVTDHVITKSVNSIVNTQEGIKAAALCVVSKSGTTAETMANFSVLVAGLSEHFDRETVYDHTVAITDPKSPLDKQAQQVGATTVHLPEQVGGRFSVLSAVGLVPLALADLPVDQLLDGAQQMRDACLSGPDLSDPAAVIAAILYEHSQNARRIINHFFFNRSAETLGRWSAQLFAESLGKRKNKQGKPVYAGLYPTTTIGPDDLHSLFQLQLGGPKNFVSVLIRETNTNQHDLNCTILSDQLLSQELEHIKGKTLGDIKQAFGEAVAEAFREDRRPYIEITVPQLDAYHTGQFILLEQLVVMYLGKLLSVNTFNQPEVESYKRTARQLLQETG